MRRVIASWFGTGLLLRRLRGSDAGSGTLAAAVTLILGLALGAVGWWLQLVAAGMVIALSLWAARPFAAGNGDPGWVVIDEAAGTLLATIGLGVWPALVAFAVFRVADASKRLPGVAAAEGLPGAVGITADDVVAGVWGLAAGWTAQLLA